MRLYRRKSRTLLRLLTGTSPVDVGQGRRVREWERRSEWPLAGAAVAFLVAYAVQVLWMHPDLVSKAIVRWVILVTWAAFVADYLVRVWLAKQRIVYAVRHWVDLAVVALPVLRPLRLLRVILLIRAINRRAAAAMRGRVIAYGAIVAVLLVFVASLGVLDAERHAADRNIRSFGDAVWWSVVTICTVGYGDRFPVTLQGRAIGVGLMIAGVGLFGVVTASFAAWLVDSINEQDEDDRASTAADIGRLHAEIGDLKVQLRRTNELLLRLNRAEQPAKPPTTRGSPRRGARARPDP